MTVKAQNDANLFIKTLKTHQKLNKFIKMNKILYIFKYFQIFSLNSLKIVSEYK